MVPPLKTYSHFIFDFDGVICDSLRFAVEEFNRIRMTHFPTLPIVQGQADMTVVYRGSLRTCLYTWLSVDDSKRFFDLHSAAMADRAIDLALFEGIAETLASLGRDGCSIVTSAYSHAVSAILDKDPFFDRQCIYQIAGRELRQSKTEKIKNILSGLSLAAREAVYVGDLESDILYCAQVPIDIIAVGYGYHPHEYLNTKKPTFCVSSVEELRDLLSELREARTISA